MWIFNYNKLHKDYKNIIFYYAKKADIDNYEDLSQDMWIYIFKHIHKLDVTKSSFRSFMSIIILTAYRKMVFGKTQQQLFEDNFVSIYPETISFSYDSNIEPYEEVISKLPTEQHVIVFYSLLLHGDRTYSKQADLLNIKYSFFRKIVKEIQEVVSKVCKNG